MPCICSVEEEGIGVLEIRVTCGYEPFDVNTRIQTQQVLLTTELSLSLRLPFFFHMRCLQCHSRYHTLPLDLHWDGIVVISKLHQ